MNYLKTILLILIISTISLSGLHAQNIDQERMQRDLNIMEGVLEELFKTQWETNDNKIRVASGVLYFGGNDEINGTYVQDYGIIFTIPMGSYGLIVNTDGEEKSYQFQYSNNSDNKEVTEETITDRIIEFLRDYGSTINQLNNNDRVTVIYNNKQFGQLNTMRLFSSSGSETKKQKLPTIFVSATSKDMQAYRNDSINENQFNNRLSITTKNNDESYNRDLKVMANILETTFEDATNDAFKIRGSVNHLYVDGLGALFNFNSSQSFNLYFVANKVKGTVGKLSTINFDSIKTTPLQVKTINFDSVKTPFKAIKTDSMKDIVFYGNLKKTSSGNNFPNHKDDAELEKERAKAFQNFLQELKEMLVDYGRTLKSVQSDEMILVSVSISNSGGDLPEHVSLNLKKSVLEAYDKGNISRKQAMEQITTREY